MSRDQLKQLIENSTISEMLAHLEYLHAFERWALEAKKVLEYYQHADGISLKAREALAKWPEGPGTSGPFPGEKK